MRVKRFSVSLVRLPLKTERMITTEGLEGVSCLACPQKQRGAGASRIILLLSANPHIPSIPKWFIHRLQSKIFNRRFCPLGYPVQYPSNQPALLSSLNYWIMSFTCVVWCLVFDTVLMCVMIGVVVTVVLRQFGYRLWCKSISLRQIIWVL